jgi:hypothetical protein
MILETDKIPFDGVVVLKENWLSQTQTAESFRGDTFFFSI